MLFIKRVYKKEIKNNEYLLTVIKNTFVKERLRTSLEWYEQNAVRNKYWFYILSIVTIICPLIADTILIFPEDSIGLKLLSAIIVILSSISAALLNLLNVRIKWNLYRRQAEFIKKELSLYGNKNVDDREEEQKLLEKIEDSMEKGYGEWEKIFDVKEVD